MPAVRQRSRTQGRLIILSGPSGAGKTTLHDCLLRSPVFKRRIIRSVSATTRAPRPGERHGKDYFFLSQRAFEQQARAGRLLEWAKVFDNYYGTPVRAVTDQLKRGKSVLLCIDVQGARQVRRKVPEALSVFVKTSSLAELRRRLEKRGTDTKKDVALRLRTAAGELKDARYYDHVVINDRLAHAQKDLEEYLATALGL